MSWDICDFCPSNYIWLGLMTVFILFTNGVFKFLWFNMIMKEFVNKFYDSPPFYRTLQVIGFSFMAILLQVVTFYF